MDVVLALVPELMRIFGPCIAAVLHVAGAAQIASEFLLRLGNVDAIIEPQAVLDPRNGSGENQLLLGAGELFFVECGQRRLRGTGEAEGEQREDGLGLHRVFSFMPEPARAGWSKGKRMRAHA